MLGVGEQVVSHTLRVAHQLLQVFGRGIAECLTSLLDEERLRIEPRQPGTR
jgi:hypothetical protein